MFSYDNQIIKSFRSRTMYTKVHIYHKSFLNNLVDIYI